MAVEHARDVPARPKMPSEQPYIAAKRESIASGHVDMGLKVLRRVSDPVDMKVASACFACSAVIVVSGTVKVRPDATVYTKKEAATRAPGAMVAGARLSVSIANPAAAL
jgi:hypothetical protein